MRKVLVVDTNVPLHDRGCIKRFGNNIIVIPIWVIEELDKFKKNQDELGANARDISRQLDHLRKQGSLEKGAPTEAGGLLIVDYKGTDFSKLPVGLLRNNDNRIILIAKAWQERKDRRGKRANQHTQEKELEYSEVRIVTKDVNLRLKADACGIIAEDYLGDKTIKRIELLYPGMETYVLPEHKKSIFQDPGVRQEGMIPARSLADTLKLDDIHANACCQFEVGKVTVSAIYKKKLGQFRIKQNHGPHGKKCDITPNNAEQRLAYELLMDPRISVVTLNGKAGSGKTLMALLAGYEQLEGVYEQLLIYRPCHEIGAPLGFRPGSTEEKFEPFMLPILDNMKFILNARINLSATGQQRGKHGMKTFKELRPTKNDTYGKVRDLIARGLLEIGPINHIRGRSIAKAFVIIDEAQNLTPLEVKTIISRAGEGTKVVLNGDVYQIDNPLVDSISNGLSHTVERLKDSELAGHITLIKCERSELAELAATFL